MDDGSVSNQRHCLTVVSSQPVSACLVIYLALHLVLKEGTATEQAGTARRGILLLSRAAFRLVPKTTHNDP